MYQRHWMLYNKAISIDRDNGDAFFYRARLNLETNNIENGIKDLREALRIDRNRYLGLSQGDTLFESIKDPRIKDPLG